MALKRAKLFHNSIYNYINDQENVDSNTFLRNLNIGQIINFLQNNFFAEMNL